MSKGEDQVRAGSAGTQSEGATPRAERPIDTTAQDTMPTSSSDISGSAAFFAPGSMYKLGFLMSDTGQSVDELTQWYETVHAPASAYMWPYLARYARNYIVKVEQGPPPPYKVIAEFLWKSEEDQQKAVALMSSPLTRAIQMQEYEEAPPWLQQIYAVMISVEPVHIKAPPSPRFRDAARTRRIMLLKRRDLASEDNFLLAVGQVAADIAKASPGAGITICMAQPGATPEGAPDSVIFIDGACGATLPQPDAAPAEIMNVFTVETRRSPVEQAAIV